MHIQHRDFATSPSLRTALKRGLTRQAMTQAARDAADLPALFDRLGALRPNRKALQRAAARLVQAPGVVTVALTADGQGLLLMLRNFCDMDTRVGGQVAFREPALIYTRVLARGDGRRAGLHLSRAGFSGHALERLVERGNPPLDRPLLAAVDAEAGHLMRGFWRGAAFADQDDLFLAARQDGVWAGSQDETAMDQEWGLVPADGEWKMPIFSARTFLGPNEMRPTVWAKWRADPALCVA